MIRRTATSPLARAHTVIASVEEAGISLQLFNGLGFTYEYHRDNLTEQQVARLYPAVSGDLRLSYGKYAARAVVIGWLQEQWYEARGEAVPAKVAAVQQDRIRRAKVATATEDVQETAEGGKAERVTAKSIITAGILAGRPAQEILDEVHEKVPGSKADEKHISYYKHHLAKEGKYTKEPKPAKEKKAKKTKAQEQVQGEAEASVEAPAGKAAPVARRRRKAAVEEVSDAAAEQGEAVDAAE